MARGVFNYHGGIQKVDSDSYAFLMDPNREIPRKPVETKDSIASLEEAIYLKLLRNEFRLNLKGFKLILKSKKLFLILLIPIKWGIYTVPKEIKKFLETPWQKGEEYLQKIQEKIAETLRNNVSKIAQKKEQIAEKLHTLLQNMKKPMEVYQERAWVALKELAFKFSFSLPDLPFKEMMKLGVEPLVKFFEKMKALTPTVNFEDLPSLKLEAKLHGIQEQFQLYSEKIQAMASEIGKKIEAKVEEAIKIVMPFFKQVEQVSKEILAKIQGVIGVISSKLKEVFEPVTRMIEKVLSFLSQKFQFPLPNFLKAIWQKIQSYKISFKKPKLNKERILKLKKVLDKLQEQFFQFFEKGKKKIAQLKKKGVLKLKLHYEQLKTAFKKLGFFLRKIALFFYRIYFSICVLYVWIKLLYQYRAKLKFDA